MRRIHGFLTFCSISLVHFTLAVVASVRSFFADAFPPGRPLLAMAAPLVPRSIEGRGFASALLNSLRHEAGVRRLSAARNT